MPEQRVPGERRDVPHKANQDEGLQAAAHVGESAPEIARDECPEGGDRDHRPDGEKMCLAQGATNV